MLLTNRLTRLVAIAVVSTVAVAALITFAFTTDAIGGGEPRTRADDRPSVSGQPTAAVPGSGAVSAEAAPGTTPTPSESAASPTIEPAAGSTVTSPGDEARPAPSTAPTSSAPTAAPTTAPAPAPTTAAPRQCYFLVLPVDC